MWIKLKCIWAILVGKPVAYRLRVKGTIMVREPSVLVENELI
jgi:hypothetical protein